jgi:hypothetical protein
MRVHIQPLAPEHSWSISTGSWLTILLTYSPDLASSDYHLFTYLKNWLESQCFNNNEDLIEGFRKVAEVTGCRLLWHRHKKCLNSGGDYAEK